MKLTKIGIAAIAAVILWPVATLLGFKFGGMLPIAAGALLFLWGMQWINDVPMVKTKKKLGFRP